MENLVLYRKYRPKAFSEVVDTVEITKTGLTPDKKAELFGEDGQTGVMDSVQSPETMHLVKKEKGKMGSLWSYVKKKTKKDS